jgi:hypothetical protein
MFAKIFAGSESADQDYSLLEKGHLSVYIFHKGSLILTSTDVLSLLFMPTFFTLTALICSVIHVATELATGMKITSRALLKIVS